MHASLLCGVLLDKVDQSIGGGVVWSHWTRGLKLRLNRLSQLFSQFHAARKDHRRNNPLITEHGCLTVEFQSTLANNATFKGPVKSNERFSTLHWGTRTSARKGVWAFGDFFFRDSPRQHRKIVFRHESIGVKIYHNLYKTVIKEKSTTISLRLSCWLHWNWILCETFECLRPLWSSKWFGLV